MAMLTIAQAAEKMGTKPRFVQRLVAERRIGFNRGSETAMSASPTRTSMSSSTAAASIHRTGPQARHGGRSGYCLAPAKSCVRT
jgi:hypothetical protein